MKSLLISIAILLVGYWAVKNIGREQASREIAQAKAIGASSLPTRGRPAERTTEQEVHQMAREAQQRGFPRQVTPEIALLSISASGKKLIYNYEFSVPFAIPLTSQLISEMRQEILQNFRSSAICRDPTRASLPHDLKLVQNYNLHRSTRTIFTIQMGAADCFA